VALVAKNLKDCSAQEQSGTCPVLFQDEFMPAAAMPLAC